MGKRHFAIDFDAARDEALAWVLASDVRKGEYKHHSDAEIKDLFDKRYGQVEEESNDLVPDRIIVDDDGAGEVRKQWFERVKTRLAKHGKKTPISIDPITLWLIGEVIYFLIMWWLDKRRKRVLREMGS